MSTASETPGSASWGDLFREGRAVYTVSLVLGIALHATDAFIVSTVMPSVVADIGGTAFYAWVVMLYMVASIVGAASGGPIKLIFGARRGYVAAGLVFLVGTVLAGSAVSMPMLLSGRLVQGFGAGMIVAQNVALISELFPGPLRTRMIALTSGVWAAAALLGPMIGGVFAQLEFWRGAFWFAVPIIVGFTLVAWRSLPDTRPSSDISLSRFPIWRVGLLGVGVLLIGTTGNIEVLPIRLAALAAGLVLVWLTIRLDGAAENRVFPSKPFSIGRPVGTAYWAFLLIAMAPLAVGIYLPLAYQTIHGLEPLAAGYLAAVLAIAWSAAAFISAGLGPRGERIAITLGPALAAAGLNDQDGCRHRPLYQRGFHRRPGRLHSRHRARGRPMHVALDELDDDLGGAGRGKHHRVVDPHGALTRRGRGCRGRGADRQRGGSRRRCDRRERHIRRHLGHRVHGSGPGRGRLARAAPHRPSPAARPRAGARPRRTSGRGIEGFDA